MPSLTKIVNPTPIVVEPVELSVYDSYWIKSLNFKSEGPSEPCTILARMVPCKFDEEGKADVDINADHICVSIDGLIDDMPMNILGTIDLICQIANEAINTPDMQGVHSSPSHIRVHYPLPVVEVDEESSESS